ncbi:MAG TPA: TIGR03560 family F420-dependent LLM class oxidoreductase [Ktedonobacteraceae bacterium]|nr:TIGR03560 family F420-dependent LLM class oxidoreductase [Ktedonobacteraceae bacterium]
MTDSQKLHFGIKTTQYFPYEDILRVWQEADTIPSIEHVWLFDHPMPIMRADPAGPCLDGWTLLTALAAQTRRLRLGLMVASNANQTPAQLAKRAATVDIISHGRLEFGIGAGGVEREHEAYGTDFFPTGERIRRLGEACEIIRRMWTEPVVNFEGRYYQLRQTYCEPKPVQKPTPPFVIGGVGEQLTLRIVAQHADAWNYPLFPLGTVEEFQHKNRVIDEYCAAIGRDPATLARSVQFIINPRENPATIRQFVQGFIAAGATHIVLGPRSLDEGIARWISEEIIIPLLEAA